MLSDSNAANSGSANFSVRMLRSVNEPSSVASDSVIGTYLPTIARAGGLASPVCSTQNASSPPSQ